MKGDMDFDWGWYNSERIGDGEFRLVIHDVCVQSTIYVWIDRYGVNLFEDMAAFLKFWAGDLPCSELHVEPYQTNLEEMGLDFVDVAVARYFGWDVGDDEGLVL